MSGVKEHGVVFRSTGSWYDVQDSSGKTVKCNLKGKIRLEGLRSTNPIAVGDTVVFERNSEDAGTIEKIQERKNFIARKSVILCFALVYKQPDYVEKTGKPSNHKNYMKCFKRF